MEAKFLASVFSFLSIFLAMYAQAGAEFLQPNYDYAEQELKFFSIRGPLVLSCNVSEGNFELTWEKNGTNVAKIKELEGRYKIIKHERKFVIERTEIFDDGIYYCVANNTKRTFNVISHVIVRVPSNINVVEGEKLSIHCIVAGTNPQLKWSIGSLNISETTDRYVLKPDENNIENAILSVENISLDDRGEFVCYGSNEANEFGHMVNSSDTSYVRVKGKFAALWPFLGICAEVFILCVIILVYERKRNKTELEESDTDQQEQ